jgi:transcriptional regulator with XRE-family HTH domain
VSKSIPIQPVYRILGARIEHIRTTLGWTQAELAEKVGLSRASIPNIEVGRQRILLHDIEALSAAFGMTPKQLLRGIWT